MRCFWHGLATSPGGGSGTSPNSNTYRHCPAIGAGLCFMNAEISIYRIGALAIGASVITQVVQVIATVSPGVGGWFIELAALVLISVGIAMFLRFQFSQWLLDGTAIILGIVGGVWL